MAHAGPPFERPMSPHLQIYKMSITMLMSGLHRITGMILYAGTVLLVLYLLAVASGPQAYQWAAWFFGSWIGKLVLFGYSWTLFHHMLGGIRHYIWDIPVGLEKPLIDRLALATVIGSLALTAITWLIVIAI